MNYCDHNHPTPAEIRILPISPNGGNLLVCHDHYLHEMRYRRERARSTGADKWQFPTWESLRIDQPKESST